MRQTYIHRYISYIHIESHVIGIHWDILGYWYDERIVLPGFHIDLYWHPSNWSIYVGSLIWVVNGFPEAHWTPSDNFACPRCECDKCVAASNGRVWPKSHLSWVSNEWFLVCFPGDFNLDDPYFSRTENFETQVHALIHCSLYGQTVVTVVTWKVQRFKQMQHPGVHPVLQRISQPRRQQPGDSSQRIYDKHGKAHESIRVPHSWDKNMSPSLVVWLKNIWLDLLLHLQEPVITIRCTACKHLWKEDEVPTVLFQWKMRFPI